MKNWKSWPYWVRGGALGAAVFFIVFVVSPFIVVADFLKLLLFFLVPVLFVGGIFEEMANCSVTVGKGIFATPNLPGCAASAEVLINTLTLLTVTILYILAGAFLGYLYGKFRNHKQLST